LCVSCEDESKLRIHFHVFLRFSLLYQDAIYILLISWEFYTQMILLTWIGGGLLGISGKGDGKSPKKKLHLLCIDKSFFIMETLPRTLCSLGRHGQDGSPSLVVFRSKKLPHDLPLS
jgi:hypothetical protein